MIHLLNRLFKESSSEWELTPAGEAMVYRPCCSTSESILLTRAELKDFLENEQNQNGAWIIVTLDHIGSRISESIIRWVPAASLWLNEGEFTRGTL